MTTITTINKNFNKTAVDVDVPTTSANQLLFA
jgi:hypothetical protein